jgi:hypothetical protein
MAIVGRWAGVSLSAGSDIKTDRLQMGPTAGALSRSDGVCTLADDERACHAEIARPRSDAMRVLCLCSVYGVAGAPPASMAGFDGVGGMQVHTDRLTNELDARGVDQVVVTAYRRRTPRVEHLGTRSRVIRTGVPNPPVPAADGDETGIARTSPLSFRSNT